jgi:hypothetical protein
MAPVYERKHEYAGGFVIARVTQEPEGYRVWLQHHNRDGHELLMAIASWDDMSDFSSMKDHFESLEEAQEIADAQVRSLGHECSAACEEWPDIARH